MKILIADDEAELRQLVENALKMSFKDMEFFHASDGRDIDRILNVEPIDLIILDLMMPYSNAVEIVSRMKDRCKIIIYTGVHDLEICKNFIRIGVDDFILKPFSIAELVDVVGKVMKTEDKSRDTLYEIREQLKRICEKLPDSWNKERGDV